jgi:hypothetical protein
MHAAIYPIIGTFVYINFVCPFKTIIKPIKTFAFFHNLFLALFSLYTFVLLSAIIWRKGIHYESNYYLKVEPQTENDKLCERLIYYFYLSKYYEYLDTLILKAQGKKTSFMQTFHHCGAVICWYLGYYYKVDTIVTATFLNSGIHTIMYTYYLLTSLKFKVGFVKPLITSSQILQLLVGNLSSLYYYYPPVESDFNYCIVIFMNVYVFILIALFCNFYYHSYIKAKRF